MTAKFQSKRKLWSLPRRKWRTTFCGFTHDWEPGLIGIAAAEFMPADPAAWFDAAVHAGLNFICEGARIVYEVPADDDGSAEFLIGQLSGSRGGHEAVTAFMAARGFKAVIRGLLILDE